MGDIGRTIKTIELEPLEAPSTPVQEPAPAPAPVQEPEPEKVGV
jgi:hypothetical protein